MNQWLLTFHQVDRMAASTCDLMTLDDALMTVWRVISEDTDTDTAGMRFDSIQSGYITVMDPVRGIQLANLHKVGPND